MARSSRSHPAPEAVLQRPARSPISRRALLRRLVALGAVVTIASATGPSLNRATAADVDPAGGAAIPDTAAGRRLARWLAAFNDANVDGLLELYRDSGSAELASTLATFDLVGRRAGGQVALHSVLESSEERVVALLRTSLSEQWQRIEIGGPAGIGRLPAPPPPEVLAGARLSDAEIGAELRRYLDQLAAADAFSGVVLVARDGVPFFTAAYGSANQATAEANRLATRFNLGSMNKMLTAVAVAQLVERGRLAFTSTLADVLPEYPNRPVAEQITIHHLLTHTSGLVDFFGPRYLQERDRLRTPWDHLPLFADQPLAFAPGTDWRYSSAGYVVLGAVVERLAGQDYFEYVRTQIYQPAGMTRSDSFERDANVPDLAIGYTVLGAGDPRDVRPEMAFRPRVENTPWLGIKGSPAGGGYATAEDLLAFDRALQGHRLLSPESTELVLAGKVETNLGPAAGRYGYGFEEHTVGGVRIVGHGGGGPGIDANLDLFLDRGVTAAVLANYDGTIPTASAAASVAQKIRELVVRG